MYLLRVIIVILQKIDEKSEINVLLTHQNYIFIHVNNKYIKNSIKAVL